jgi:2-polyprenyl-3-methyl-5-hydroxy-6-metoxy-1,4-benzoquinol methylase/spore coat polysaccharide biosynthesis predicted glycosyltransferase SpsG
MATPLRPPAQNLAAGERGAPLVFVPAFGPGAGIGHLKRCLDLLAAVGERGFLLLEKNRSLDKRWYEGREELRKLMNAVSPEKIIEGAGALPEGACIVFDSRETDAPLFRTVASRVLTVGLDEGGRRRERFSLLFDTLPMIKRRSRPNDEFLPFRPRAAARREPRFPFRKILLSFGGEDRAGLTGVALRALLDGLRLAPQTITVVEGPLFARRRWPEGVAVIRDCRDLPGLLDRFDLLITHYGLTAYESLDRGVPVVLLNPSSYHRRLAKADGLPEIGVRKAGVKRLKRLLGGTEEHERALAAFRARTAERRALPDALRDLKPAGSVACPVCGSASDRALARFPLKTYFRCPRCGIVRLVYWGAPKRYGADYFAAEYEAQYGKTYLEDFENIKRTGLRRLDVIEKLARFASSVPPANAGAGGTSVPAGPALLDVGAAFGPFLAAARERGYRASGIECSPEGSAYIRAELCLPCLTGDFLASEMGVRLEEKSFDIISMWFVIEHFVPTGDALDRVHRLLKPGGLFAFSTPSGSGISCRKNRRLFLEKSPDDHFTVWTPRSAARALKRRGFRVVKIVVTGHHPERFFKKPADRLVSAVVLFISKLFRLGDTFEVYSRRVDGRKKKDRP